MEIVAVNINCQLKYSVSKNIIAREIEGEIIIVPMISGLGDLNSEMYTLNKTGFAIWEKLDGRTTLNKIIDALAIEFNTSFDQIENDVLEIMQELFNKGLIVEN